MPITVLSEWFLLEFKIAELKAYLVLEKLRRLNRAIWFQLQEMYRSIASIALWRLTLLMLKRLGSITKNWLKENKIDEWLKAILHGAYLGAFEGLNIFLYFLHFFGAFLTIIVFFSDRENKNLVEVTKFLYALFKIFISLLMLTFMLVLIAHGLAPLTTMSYQAIKLLFRIYTFSRLAISITTLGFSYYQLKTCNKASDHDWLKANYQANVKKHFEILVIAIPITVLLTLISLGIATGPWFWVVLGLASLFLVFDMAKAIYYYINRCKIPEPQVGTLTQQNSFINVSINDYYYRKCRSARLEINNIEKNRIYLLKEYIVYIKQLQIELAHHSASRFIFFSKRPQHEKMILYLKHDAAFRLLTDDDQKNKIIHDNLVIAFQNDQHNLIETSDKGLFSKEHIENIINELKDNSSCKSIFDELLCIKNSPRDKLIQENTTYSQPLKQSFSRKKSEGEDLLKAGQDFTSQKKTNKTAIHEKNCVKTDGILALRRR